MKIEGLVIRVSDTETIQLSLEEAEKLYSELDRIFRKDYTVYKLDKTPIIIPPGQPLYPNYTITGTNNDSTHIYEKRLK